MKWKRLCEIVQILKHINVVRRHSQSRCTRAISDHHSSPSAWLGQQCVALSRQARATSDSHRLDSCCYATWVRKSWLFYLISPWQLHNDLFPCLRYLPQLSFSIIYSLSNSHSNMPNIGRIKKGCVNSRQAARAFHATSPRTIPQALSPCILHTLDAFYGLNWWANRPWSIHSDDCILNLLNEVQSDFRFASLHHHQTTEMMPSTRNFPRKLCCSLKGKGVHCVRTLSESTYFGCWLDAYYKQASIFFCPGGGTNSKPVEPPLLLSCRSVSD